MSAAAAGKHAGEKAEAADAAPAGGGRKKLLVLLAIPLLLAAIGGGLWFSGVLPHLLGRDKPTPAQMHAAAEAKPIAPPVYVALPEIVANLNAGPRHASFVKLTVQVELAREQDKAAVSAAMPRLNDLFQTYLRDMHPDELRGSAGIYRLREEMIARANIALAPVQVVDVLFTDILVQ